MEEQLIAFIEDSGKPVAKDAWFDFDRLLFKIGGYTDTDGNAAANKKLSFARAAAVAKDLVALGVTKKRLVPEGYGAEHPTCPANDTPERKAKNRRIALRATAK